VELICGVGSTGMATVNIGMTCLRVGTLGVLGVLGVMGLMLGVETGEGGDEKRGGDLGWTLLIFEKISGTVHVVPRIAGIDSGADGLNGNG
jgi:hypothetical protein